MIRQVDVSVADVLSAKTFFDALFSVYDLGRARVLDAFARNGQLTVQSYLGKLVDPRRQLECWELMQEHEPALRAISDNVEIGDSYRLINEISRVWDVLVVDTPQGLHRDSKGKVHAEHWDFLKEALPRLPPGAILVLYVNMRPYDARKLGSHGYDEYPEYDYDRWMLERQKFYGYVREFAEEEFIMRYRDFLQSEGRKVKSVLAVPCHSDVLGLEPYAFRLGLQLA